MPTPQTFTATVMKKDKYEYSLRFALLDGTDIGDRISKLEDFCKKAKIDDVMFFIDAEDVNHGHCTIEEVAPHIEAIKKANYIPGKDFTICIDAASSEWYDKDNDNYFLPKSQLIYSKEELVNKWKRLISLYPISSIEDGMGEEDYEGWKLLTNEIGNKVQLVGDDLFVTNVERLTYGIDNNIANSILIKVNQIGTLSETIDTIKKAQSANYKVIISHRSGETEDTTIADLGVALHCDQIKSGAPSRSERVAKYNQLLRIEEKLG